MTAEMLKEGYPQFEEASFILLEIEEVNIYLGLNVHTCMHVHCHRCTMLKFTVCVSSQKRFKTDHKPSLSYGK